MKRSSGEQQPLKSTSVSDFDCIVNFYVGSIKAVVLHIARLGLKLGALLRSI